MSPELVKIIKNRSNTNIILLEEANLEGANLEEANIFSIGIILI